MRLRLSPLFFLGVLAASSLPALAQEPTLTDLIQFPTGTVTGRQPSTRVTIGANGSIYGTTSLGGGTCDCGSVWNYSATPGAANLYSGATTVNQGTLQVGNNTAAGDLGTSSGVTLVNGANLTFNRSSGNALSYTNPITESGVNLSTITQAGAGAGMVD